MYFYGKRKLVKYILYKNETKSHSMKYLVLSFIDPIELPNELAIQSR